MSLFSSMRRYLGLNPEDDYSIQFLKLLEEVAEDGELTANEIRKLAGWLRDNPEGRKTWPADQFLPLLKCVFADGKIERAEAQIVAQLTQSVLRQWARHRLQAAPPKAKAAGPAAKFDDSKARLPALAAKMSVASASEADAVYEVDFNGPTCTCPDFRGSRKHLPAGHLSRCCKHIFEGYSQLRPESGWPGWLDSFLETGFRPHPDQTWAIAQVGNQNWLVSSESRGWGNLYLPTGNQHTKYGYSVSEDRWSYGKEPPHKDEIAAAIRKLSKR